MTGGKKIAITQPTPASTSCVTLSCLKINSNMALNKLPTFLGNQVPSTPPIATAKILQAVPKNKKVKIY